MLWQREREQLLTQQNDSLCVSDSWKDTCKWNIRGLLGWHTSLFQIASQIVTVSWSKQHSVQAPPNHTGRSEMCLYNLNKTAYKCGGYLCLHLFISIVEFSSCLEFMYSCWISASRQQCSLNMSKNKNHAWKKIRIEDIERLHNKKYWGKIYDKKLLYICAREHS